MDSVDAVAERLTHVLTSPGNARRMLAKADVELTAAVQLWNSLFRESANPDAAQVASVAEQAVTCVAEQLSVIHAAEQRIQRYLASIGVSWAQHSAVEPAQQTAAPANTMRPEVPASRAESSRPVVLQDRVVGYREELEHPWPYGRPLRGWLLADDQPEHDRELVSGRNISSGEVDPAYEHAVRRSRELGLARGGFAPDITRHIEIKQAASMSSGETRTIVIGKDPCGIDPVTNVSCHRFLPYFLPAGATLIVYGPTGDPYRYEGKSLS